MQKDYDFAVFIGRFQPFHNGHKRIIDRALKIADKVVVLIGSADSGRTLRNPFTFAERANMILDSFNGTEAYGVRILCEPLPDIAYNDQHWVAQVQKIIENVVVRDMNSAHPNVTISGHADANIALIGHSKDNTSYYLKLFPQWSAVNVPQTELLAATDIRNQFFDDTDTLHTRNKLHGMAYQLADSFQTMPPAVAKFMLGFMDTPEYKTLCEEHNFIQNYKKSWAGAPYTPVFVTTDAVVVQSGHVLLIRRKNHPGQGMLALPGGFLNPDETLRQCVVRELREETMIEDRYGPIPPGKLDSMIVAERVFDVPTRDVRGRVVTHAFLFKLPDHKNLGLVHGADDAEAAEWYPLGTLKRSEMYADHYDIIQEMVGAL